MLTVCLPRLGDFPTLWFLIRHMMRKMGDWHLSRGSLYRPDWFDFVCISSARIDGNDFWSTLPIVAAAADPLRWKMLAFHISISINLGNCPIKTGNYIYFFVDCTWCQQASAAETEDSCFVYPDRVSLNRLKSNLFFFFFWGKRHTKYLLSLTTFQSPITTCDVARKSLQISFFFLNRTNHLSCHMVHLQDREGLFV